MSRVSEGRVPIERMIRTALVLTVASLTIIGCATTADLAPSNEDAVGTVVPFTERISGEDEEFLSQATILLSERTIGDGSEIEFFVSFPAWEEGREIVNRIVPIGSKIVDRVERAAIVLAPTGSVAVVEVSVSRLATSLALNAEGWERIAWGVWQDPDETTTVEFHRKRVLQVTTATGTHGAPSRGFLGVQNDRSMFVGAGGTVWAYGLIDKPTFAGIAADFQPQTMEFAGFSGGEATAMLTFRDERSARVALVPLRLRGERAFGTYGFRIGEGFDIFRERSVVFVAGVYFDALTVPEEVQ